MVSRGKQPQTYFAFIVVYPKWCWHFISRNAGIYYIQRIVCHFYHTIAISSIFQPGVNGKGVFRIVSSVSMNGQTKLWCVFTSSGKYTPNWHEFGDNHFPDWLPPKVNYSILIYYLIHSLSEMNICIHVFSLGITVTLMKSF